MTKEEFEQLKSTVKQWLFHTGSLDPTSYANELKLKFIEPREKQLTKAKETINKLIELVDFFNEDNVKEPVIAEAEQFLKEI